MPRHTRPLREAPGLVKEAEGARGKHKQESVLWFLWEGMGEAEEAGSELAGLNNFSGLWGIGTVPSSLVPGLEVIRAGG